MEKSNKFTVDDYENIDNLIESALDNMDKDLMDKLTPLKTKIYDILVSYGLKDEVENVIKKKWDVIDDPELGRVYIVRKKRV